MKNPKKRKKKSRKKVMGLDARREQVAALLKKDYSKAQIATILGVSRTTIVNDIKSLQKTTTNSVNEVVTKPAEMLAVSLQTWSDVIEDAKTGFHAANNPAQKNAFLRTISGANNDRIKVLMDLGILQRAPTRHDMNMNIIDGVNIGKASAEELASLERSLAAKAALKGVDIISTSDDEDWEPSD